MRVLGIDPGSSCTGYGVLEEGPQNPRVITSGVVRVGDGPLPGRLTQIFAGVEALLLEYRPDAVAVEDVFFAKSVRSALVLGHARGVVLLAAGRAGLPVFEYPPREVKQVVTGSGAADKEQVRKMLKLSLGEVPEAIDASDALAVALCHLHSRKLGELLRVPGRKGKRQFT